MLRFSSHKLKSKKFLLSIKENRRNIIGIVQVDHSISEIAVESN